MTISEALQQGSKTLKAQNIDSAHLDAEILLLHAINNARDKTWLYSHLDDDLDNTSLILYKKYIARRKKHEPVAYITNTKAFYGLDFFVNENVLIPRPETEMIIDYALKLLSKNPVKTEKIPKRKTFIIDVGTGSGAIAVSIASHTKNNDVKIIATDASKEALEVAEKNSKKNSVSKFITFLHGHLLEPVLAKYQNDLDQASVIILANLPYLSEDDISKAPPDLSFEPLQALYSDDNGLSHYNLLLSEIRLLANAKNNYTLLLEHHDYQTESLHALAKKTFPKSKIQTKKDAANLRRLTIITI